MARDRERSGSGPTATITRRDFLHDVGLAGAACALSPLALGETATSATGHAPTGRDYPPTKTGLRGSHAGAYETAHALAREGQAFAAGEPLDEHYDLVVVGAGISGLAAAYFYRQQHGRDARILLLDNHDDFGGHAKRNEFHQGGAMQLGWGGTVNIEYWNYSEVGNRLLRELGVDLERLLAGFDFNWGSSGTGLAAGTWFDRETYGEDVFVPGFHINDFGRDALRAAAPHMPLSPAAREALLRFVDREGDVLAGLTDAQRRAWARRTRYVDFLGDHGALPAEAIQVLSQAMMGIWGVRTDDLSVAECLDTGLPGAHLLGLPEATFTDASRAAMFPDGNASIARLLVRSLILGAFPEMPAERDPHTIVTEVLDYAALDRARAPVRLRLNATVLQVENRPEGGVALSYAKDGKLQALRAKRCILACYNRIIPHICPSLPAQQQAGLAQCIKRPLGTINVVLRDGAAIDASGIAGAYLPGSMLQLVSVVNGIEVGTYGTAWNPAEPCLVHFFFGVSPERPEGLDMVEQSQAGRLRLLSMSFGEFEEEVRRVLVGIWGPHGLNVDEDILAITVNRWPHGYARDLLDLEDPAWLADPGPYEIGRQPFGNIAIANSDAGADAYTHTAIDQAWRAVNDLPARG